MSTVFAKSETVRGDWFVVDATDKILGRLCTPEFLGSREQGWEGVIKHAIYHRNKNLGVNESVMWGDYFFVEALDKLLGAPAVG